MSDVYWQQIQQRLHEELGDAMYRSWISPLRLNTQELPQWVLIAPSRFMCDWVSNHYLSKIEQCVKVVTGKAWSVQIVSDDSKGLTSAHNASSIPSSPSFMNTSPSSGHGNGGGKHSPTAATISHEPMALDLEANTLSAELDQRFTFENFVVGKPNELAYAAAQRVAESQEVLYNPLFLYGGVGLGKTHLMHAIAWHIKTCYPKRKVIYLSAEKFMYQFVRALRFKDTVAFKDQFRSVDVLMIDDVQFISGKDSTQEEFFHTFNALVDQNRQVIISADKSPSDLEGMEERLKSRLGWGLVADIHPTTYELRLGILQAKADTLNARVPKEVIEFLASKITSNIRELEGALNRLVAHSTLIGRDISVDTTQDVLRDLIKSNDRRATIDDIQKRVAEYYGIKIADLHSARRSQNVARPRQMAMYLCKKLTSRSYPDIGRKFGGRDHTTVLHAVRKVEELCQKDREFADDLSILTRTLQH